ncbi:MAG: YceD family protein [Micrococcales bacterium]
MSSNSFKIQVHDLIRKPGGMREHNFDVVLGEDFGNAIAAVRVGETLELDTRLESVHEGILVTGVAFATAQTECSRCLDELKLAVEVDFQELFAYSGTQEEDFLVQDDQVDLEQVVRDAVVLSLPFQPVCRPNCLGLCPECGVKMAKDPNHVHDQPIDSRWAELQKLQSKEE